MLTKNAAAPPDPAMDALAYRALLTLVTQTLGALEALEYASEGACQPEVPAPLLRDLSTGLTGEICRVTMFYQCYLAFLTACHAAHVGWEAACAQWNSLEEDWLDAQIQARVQPGSSGCFECLVRDVLWPAMGLDATQAAPPQEMN